jgi:hypothetical protein
VGAVAVSPSNVEPISIPVRKGEQFTSIWSQYIVLHLLITSLLYTYTRLLHRESYYASSHLFIMLQFTHHIVESLQYDRSATIMLIASLLDDTTTISHCRIAAMWSFCNYYAPSHLFITIQQLYRIVESLQYDHSATIMLHRISS